MTQIELGAHGSQPVEVEVDWARPEVVSTRQRDPRLAAPSQQRTENENGGAHLAHQLQGRFRMGHVRNVDEQRPVLSAVASADVAEDLTHDVDIENAGDVIEPVLPGSQQ